MKIAHPFHEGEISVQEELGERDIALGNARLYEDSVIVPAQKFLTQQSYLIVALADTVEHIPITVLYGDIGFIGLADSAKVVVISLVHHTNQIQDPVIRKCVPGARIGSLAIELSSRKRLRINGHIRSVSTSQIEIVVDESYPNCPKYIQKRTVDRIESPEPRVEVFESGTKMEESFKSQMRKADTFFVSSLNPTGFADASHRGGEPGFIRMIGDSTLRIPDYPGNSLYNTFGNFKLNPNAGLLFWDFDTNSLLHLQGTVELDFGQTDSINETGGTGRWWKFHVHSWEKQTLNIPFWMKFREYSSFNPKSQNR